MTTTTAPASSQTTGLEPGVPRPAPSRARSSVRELRVFWAATGAVMLHVADDNFFQPADGVSAADHLASGLVPLGLLGLAAAAYPRVRAGARGLIALSVALAGLVVGLIEAGYYTLTVGPSGDDYTGFLAAAAGFVLLGLGAMVLWRSRRTGGSRTRRYLRRVVRGVLGVVVVTELVAPFAFGYLVTHVGPAEVPGPDLGAAHEDVTLTTSDGLHLEGWYVPSRNGAAVIAIPGPHGPAGRTPGCWSAHGYGVLLFDSRGDGESDGDAQHVRLGRRAGHPRGRRLPQAPARRRARTRSAASASRSAAR